MRRILFWFIIILSIPAYILTGISFMLIYLLAQDNDTQDVSNVPNNLVDKAREIIKT